MVMSFRVSELQVLLGFAGRNKSGRKQELLQRALLLVQKGCSMPVQIKIRELYRQIYASTQRRRFTGSGSPPGVMVPTEGNQQIVSPGMSPLGPLDFSNKNIASVSPVSTGIPVHPDVRFKRLPFYDVLGELLKPTSLMPKSTSRFQESGFVFHLTPQQAQDIAMSRDFRPGAKCEYTVQVQLRFCLLETSCEQEDNFPPSICVRVNGKMTALPNPIPTSKPGVEPKRPGRPVDITSLCRLSPTVSNHLDVSWASEFGRGYCLAVYLVRRLSSDILLQRLKQFGNRHSDHTRALIKEKLAHDPESEVATTSLRVSLMCPLGKMRMVIPCRASTCTHLQCFDASTFLLMNEKKPTWICPVCDKPATFDKLIIDGYFVEIFRQSPETNEIVFHEDGSWTTLKQQKETHVIASPVVLPAAIVTQPVPQSSSSGSKQQDVIDLTLDSSDEDDIQGPSTPVTITPGPSHGSDASNSSGCVSPAVINLDAPTPSPIAVSCHSLSASPASMVISSSHSASQSPFSSPGPSPVPSTLSSIPTLTSSAMASTSGAPPPAHSLPQRPHSSHRNSSSSSFTSGSLLGAPPPLTTPTGLLVPGSGASSHLPIGPINLEALSEQEFEEFLHGLSWGV